MKQQTGSKLGKEYDKAVYCLPAYLIYMQCTSYEMPGWMNHELKQDCQETYQQPHICRLYHSNGRQLKGPKEPLDEGEKAGLKFSIQKTEIMASCPITSWQIEGKGRGSDRFFFLGLQNHCGQ